MAPNRIPIYLSNTFPQPIYEPGIFQIRMNDNRMTQYSGWWRYWVVKRWRSWVRTPGESTYFSLIQRTEDRPLGTNSLLFNRYRVHSEGKTAEAWSWKLTSMWNGVIRLTYIPAGILILISSKSENLSIADTLKDLRLFGVKYYSWWLQENRLLDQNKRVAKTS
jgi:hypothetical protein